MKVRRHSSESNASARVRPARSPYKRRSERSVRDTHHVSEDRSNVWDSTTVNRNHAPTAAQKEYEQTLCALSEYEVRTHLVLPPT